MKKILSLLMLLCITLGAQAQLLWKVSGGGLDRPSYLIGTHHLAPLSIIDSLPGFKPAMAAVEQVCGEMVTEDILSPENVQLMQRAAMLPAGTTLRSLFTEAQYDSVALHIKNLMGADLKMFDGVKPSLLSAQITAISALQTIEGYNPQQQLDGWIQSEAKAQGKIVGGLETMDIQLNVMFNAQTLERQAEILYNMLTDMERTAKQARDLTDAYMHQDLAKMEELVRDEDGADEHPEETEVLIYNRNENWMKLMPQIMAEHPTLFAVGAGHLVGERGIIALLRKAGYTVEAVE